MLDKYFVNKLVTEINSLQADVICIAGDIFDNDYEALKNPEETSELFSKLESVYGVYACLGNHDIDGLFQGEGNLGHEKMKQ